MKSISDPLEMNSEFQTTHQKAFEIAPWSCADFDRFRVGSCEGLWTCRDGCYQILAIENTQSGNGHLNDVFEWFEHSSKRENLDLMVLEVWNKRFKKHLLKKRGFVAVPGTDHVIKRFKR